MNISLNLFYIIKKMIDSRLVKVMIILQAVLSCPNRALSRENLSSGGCEQHRHRPACAFTQSDQRLCYSLFGKYHM